VIVDWTFVAVAVCGLAAIFLIVKGGGG